MQQGLIIGMRRGALMSGVAFAVLGAGSVHAQTAGNTPTPAAATVSEDNGDIVVTALKRATTAATTPIAITAVSGDTLAAMNITTSDSLQQISPGLVVRESPFSGSRLSIRNIRSAGEPTVGLYYDETPITGSAGVGSDAGGTTPNIRLFDVERVEVLRGPQGTLYGSSSEAGTIRLIFNKPDATEFAGAASGKLYTVDGGGTGFETQAMLNLPVATDKLAVRAVGFYQDLPGFIDSTRYNRSNINDVHSKGGRATVRATPTDDLTIDLLAVIQTTKGGLNDYNLAVGKYKQAYESREASRDHFEIYSGTVNYDLGPVAITGVASHSTRDFNYYYDSSAFVRLLASRFPPASPQFAAVSALAPSVAQSPQDTKTDTAELRAATDGTGPFQITGGVFYSDRDGDFVSNIRRTSAVDGSLRPLDATTLIAQRIIGDKLKQTAVFGEASYELFDRLTLTGGARRYHYKREVSGQVTVPNAFFSFAAGPAINLSETENGWLYKANISYKFADRGLVYATYSTGQRPGGLNQAVGLPAQFQTYLSDNVHNYEVGVKGSLLDRMLSFNADVFQIDWDDIQTTGTLPATPFIFIANASKARARGVEAELNLTPFEGLTFQLSGAYIEAELTANQASPGLTAPGLDGDPIPSAPKFTLQPSLQYAVPVGSNLRATARVDGYHQSASWIGFRHLNELFERLPAYTTVALRAGVSTLDDRWSVSAYANNLTNKSTPVSKYGMGSIAFGNQPRAISLTPRTVGLELSTRF